MKFLKFLDKALYGFFIIFFALYIGKFGISSFVIADTGAWSMLLNVGVWFMLMSVCIREVFPEPEEKKKVRWAK